MEYSGGVLVGVLVGALVGVLGELFCVRQEGLPILGLSQAERSIRLIILRPAGGPPHPWLESS